MIIEIDVSDKLTPATQRALAHSEAYLRHISKSLGFWFQDETKKAINEGAPNGERYEERIPYKVRKDLDKNAKTYWYGQLRQAIGYEYIGKGTVALGWTSPTASWIGHSQEYGFSRDVTSPVRAKWAKAGHPLSKSKTELNVPERPVFEPMVRQLKPKVAPYVEEKVREYINENVEYGVKKDKRRIYKVYK